MSLVDSIINTAKTYIGTTEGSNNHREIIDLYNKGRYSDAYQMTMNDPWCCAFVVAMFVQCNASDIIPCYAACDQMIHTFKAWGRWKNRSSEVHAGDIIFYDWNGDSSSDHVGIVVQNRFGELSVIEGNKSDTVAYRTISNASPQIVGYGVPNYEGSDGNGSSVNSTGGISDLDKNYINTLPLLFKGCKNVFVKVLQLLLNYYGGCELDLDGDFGPRTYNAVKAYQKANKIEVDGVVGRETWTYLLILDHK